MRIVAFGGWGQIGSELAQVAAGRHELVRPSRAEVDVTDPEAVALVVAMARPDVVVNAAAFHKVELCEVEPSTAMAVNALGALCVARAAKEVGARTVFISSDYVFDGEVDEGYAEDSCPHPLNIYGVSKAAGESAVRAADPSSIIVRISGVFGHAGSSGKGGNFVETMLAKAEAGDSISVVNDLRFAPTCATDFADRLLAMLERDPEPGPYHLSNAGSCTWLEFAARIFELSALSPELSGRSSEADPVPRPRSSVLLDTRTTGLGLPPPRPWEEALAWYLKGRTKSAWKG